MGKKKILWSQVIKAGEQIRTGGRVATNIKSTLCVSCKLYTLDHHNLTHFFFWVGALWKDMFCLKRIAWIAWLDCLEKAFRKWENPNLIRENVSCLFVELQSVFVQTLHQLQDTIRSKIHKIHLKLCFYVTQVLSCLLNNLHVKRSTLVNNRNL